MHRYAVNIIRGLRAMLLIGLTRWCMTCQPKAAAVKAELSEIRGQAIAYLLTQQSDDGAWHSNTHGILRGGQAYTPYIVDALLPVAQEVRGVDTALIAAYSFMANHLDSAGVLGKHNAMVVEYPVYATAIASKVWATSPFVFDTLWPQPALDYLLTQQFTTQRCIDASHPAYGGWGFGEEGLPCGEVGHLDLSHTRRVLESLSANGYPDTSIVWSKAVVFLDRLQQADGGFCASTYTLGANKADRQGETCRPYATATADGILALLALPNPPEAQLNAAKEWLLQHEDWTAPPGIEPGQPGDWERVLFFYHLSVRAQAYRALNVKSNWPTQLLAVLDGKQSEDGAFSNPWGAPNKEDDPLLATTLVIKAINAALGK